MKKRRAGRRESTYAYLAVLNLGVLCMFAIALMPAPRPALQAVELVGPVEQRVVAAKEPVIGTAIRVTVPSANIDTPVRTGEYDGDTRSWQVDTTAAFHANTTVPVNNTNGRTLIYGHAQWPIFNTLPEVRSGAEAQVYTSEGLRFDYVFELSRQVDPRDTSWLTEAGPPTLILQTCSGAFDAYRTLVAFRLKGVVYE